MHEQGEAYEGMLWFYRCDSRKGVYTGILPFPFFLLQCISIRMSLHQWILHLVFHCQIRNG